MEQATEAPLKKTPLNARHRASGAKMVPFGGWDMPVEYSGLSNEHTAVRTRAGLFDVSHMGEIEIAGKDQRFLQRQTFLRVAKKSVHPLDLVGILICPERVSVGQVKRGDPHDAAPGCLEPLAEGDQVDLEVEGPGHLHQRRRHCDYELGQHQAQHAAEA